MSWPMPIGNQWNPGVPPMAPDMGAYSTTSDQWALMQQQNWHQWAQWQQQYAQWQNQYGEKYAQQMHAMGGMPPLPPNNAPLPAPPPPEQKPPPPPPPHENNQPLYRQSQSQPTPVPPPSKQQNQTVSSDKYTNNNSGDNQNWNFPENALPDKGQQSLITGNNQDLTDSNLQSQAGNSEALKNLAEEERHFDIQFKTWEEEIEKWRRENVNHPDKQAYKDYEQKFEACRLQLLERRQQMKLKRARLLGNVAQASNASLPINKASSAPPPAQENNKIFTPNLPSQTYNTMPPNLEKEASQVQYQNYSNISGQHQISQSNFNRNNHEIKKHNYDKSLENDNRNVNVRAQSSYSYSEINEGYPGNEERYDVNDNYSPNDEYTSNDFTNDDYIPNDDDYPINEVYAGNEDYNINKKYLPDDSKFLPAKTNPGGIPGLDLVPENRNVSQPVHQEVVDITDEPPVKANIKNLDYSTISKGINNILGDEKIMNILSMVRNQSISNDSNQDSKIVSSPYTGIDNLSNTPNQWNRNFDPHNTEFSPHRQNIPPNRESTNYPWQQIDSKYTLSQKGNLTNRNAPISREQYNQNNEHSVNKNPANFAIRSNNSPIMSCRPPFQEMSTQQNLKNYPREAIGNVDARHPNVENNMKHHMLQRQKWIDEPIFSPTLIVEYEHKSLRLKAREFIEPVHMFDYNHKSKKDDEFKKRDFEKEVDELFSRKRTRLNDDAHVNYDRFSKDQSWGYERRNQREEFRDEYRGRLPPRMNDYEPMEYEDRQRKDYRYDDKRRDDKDKYTRRDDRDRDSYRERQRDYRRDEVKNQSRSRETDNRKRAHSKESDASVSKKSDTSTSNKKSKEFDSITPHASSESKHIVMIDDLLEPPGRDIRPQKIVIILRGPPGSGKSYLAKLIRDKEAEHGGTVRIMSIDDYFMQEGEIEEKDPATGKIVKKPSLKYEYDEKLVETYTNSLKRAFKRSLTDGYFQFLIYDAVNDQLKNYADIWNFARQNGFQTYICTMELDPQICYKRNIHNHSLSDIQVICTRFFPTPDHHIHLDATTLLQSAAITEVQMEDVSDVVILDDSEDPEVENVFTSKWERTDDAEQLARLDGTNKPLRPSHPSMEDYLQLEEWKPAVSKPGKKTVRWADIEEQRQQEKMRAIGFVVGQTDWGRMTDPTMGSGALTQTKYIERVKRF